VGVLLLAFLVTGLEQVGVAPWVQPVVQGCALILAVALSSWAVRARLTRLRVAQLALLEAERASIAADPAGELEELAGIYEGKGLDPRLARQVAEALTQRDPVAAHADAELRLETLGPTSGAARASVTAGLCYGIGAAVPLAAMSWLPLDDRASLAFVIVLIALGVTGWFAAWLTELPVLRLVRRNILLGGVIMLASILAGLALH